MYSSLFQRWLHTVSNFEVLEKKAWFVSFGIYYTSSPATSRPRLSFGNLFWKSGKIREFLEFVWQRFPNPATIYNKFLDFSTQWLRRVYLDSRLRNVQQFLYQIWFKLYSDKAKQRWNTKYVIFPKIRPFACAVSSEIRLQLLQIERGCISHSLRLLCGSSRLQVY